MNILLIGLRCSGKSTLGAALSTRSGKAFVDLDDVTPRMMGVAGVAEAFARFGEAEFRRAEGKALRTVLATDHQVIALGGGTPTAPGVAELIRDVRASGAAVVIYLRGSAETLRARLAVSTRAHRPSLTGADPVDEVNALLRARDGAYSEIADYIIEIDGRTIEDVLGQVVSICESR